VDGGEAHPVACDLTDAASRDGLLTSLPGLDVLILNSGVIHLGTTQEALLQDFRDQLESNVVAPYSIVQGCLPMLLASRGQVVFINSSAGKSAGPGVGQFSATQHATRALADSLRAEVNERGVRVTVVHPGRTATPRQAAIHQLEGKDYVPERLMQPEDVAATVMAVLTLPRTAEVTEVAIRPMLKS
jgi:NADP-dependent 3-hydroxy acid dehydrogenase YdfG